MLHKTSMDKARLLYYGLFSKLFVFKESSDRFEHIDDMLAIIKTNPLNSNVKEASIRLLNTIDTKGYKALSSEYDAIFHSLKYKSLARSASFYEEGIEFGNKCIQTRSFLAKTAIRRDEKTYKDPEDSIGFLMVFMFEMIQAVTQNSANYESVQHCLFSEIINPFIDDFIENLFNHKASKSYKDVAILLSAFVEFERLYFEVEKPQPINKKRKSKEGLSAAEAKRRAINKAKKELDKESMNICEI